MEAAISDYAQATLNFTEADLNLLEKEKHISGEIVRYPTGGSEYFERHKLPLHVYLVENEDEIRVGGIPLDKPWEEKTAYEIAMVQRQIDILRLKKYPLYWDMLGRNIHLRSIWISLEGVL